MNFKNLQRNFLYNARPRKLKKKVESKKMELRYFPMNFHVCVSFMLSHAYHALILDLL